MTSAFKTFLASCLLLPILVASPPASPAQTGELPALLACDDSNRCAVVESLNRSSIRLVQEDREIAKLTLPEEVILVDIASNKNLFAITSRPDHSERRYHLFSPAGDLLSQGDLGYRTVRFSKTGKYLLLADSEESHWESRSGQALVLTERGRKLADLPGMAGLNDTYGFSEDGRLAFHLNSNEAVVTLVEPRSGNTQEISLGLEYEESLRMRVVSETHLVFLSPDQSVVVATAKDGDWIFTEIESDAGYLSFDLTPDGTSLLGKHTAGADLLSGSGELLASWRARPNDSFGRQLPRNQNQVWQVRLLANGSLHFQLAKDSVLFSTSARRDSPRQMGRKVRHSVQDLVGSADLEMESLSEGETPTRSGRSAVTLSRAGGLRSRSLVRP